MGRIDDDPNKAASEAVDAAYDNFPEGKYGKPDPYNDQLLGISSTKKKMEGNLDAIESNFTSLERWVNNMMAAKGKDKRQHALGMAKAGLSQVKKWMVTFQLALENCRDDDIDDLRAIFNELDKRYDALVAEMEDPRYLSVLNRKAMFDCLAGGKRNQLEKEGFEDMASNVSGNMDKQPFSLAYGLVDGDKVLSTREVTQIAITNCLAQGEESEDDVSVFARIDRTAWSKERAKYFEAKLFKIVEKIPGVINAQGCSYDGYKDFKIHFEFEGSEKPTHGYFLEYKPSENTLVAWAGGLGYDIPSEVIECIGKIIPETSYRMKPGTAVGGFHHWRGVFERKFNSATGGDEVEDSESEQDLN